MELSEAPEGAAAFSIDQTFSPGEKFLMRVNRYGKRENRYRIVSNSTVCIGPIWFILISIILIGDLENLWSVSVYERGSLFFLSVVLLICLVTVVRKYGYYTVEGVVTTDRVLAGRGWADGSDAAELKMADVVSLELARRDGSLVVVIAGRQGQEFLLRSPIGASKLAAVIASAANLPVPPEPSRLKTARMFLLILAIIFICGGIARFTLLP